MGIPVVSVGVPVIFFGRFSVTVTMVVSSLMSMSFMASVIFGWFSVVSMSVSMMVFGWFRVVSVGVSMVFFGRLSVTMTMRVSVIFDWFSMTVPMIVGMSLVAVAMATTVGEGMLFFLLILHRFFQSMQWANFSIGMISVTMAMCVIVEEH